MMGDGHRKIKSVSSLSPFPPRFLSFCCYSYEARLSYAWGMLPFFSKMAPSMHHFLFIYFLGGGGGKAGARGSVLCPSLIFA